MRQTFSSAVLCGRSGGSSRRRLSVSRFIGLVGSLVCLSLVLAVMSVFAGSALAKEAHVFTTSFGSAGSGDGQVELAEHSGLAVDQTTHDVYVADTGNHRIDQFSAAGTFIRAFGANVGGAGVNVCTSGCVAGTPGSSPGAFEAPTFIAVDNSAGASAGDVYVADTADNIVTKFEADGTLIASWGTGGQLNGEEAKEPFAGPFAEIVGITIDASGNLDVLENSAHALFRFGEDATFLTDFETPRGSAAAGLAVDPSGDFFKVNGVPNVERFNASGIDIGQVTLPAEPGPTEAATGLAVDPATGTLYVDHGGTSIDTYAFAASGEVIGSGCIPAPHTGCTPTGSFGRGNLTSGAGLAVDGSSHVLYAADAGAAQVAVFIPAVLPDATTEPAQVINGGVTLHGVVNAAGGPPATCVFQYVDVTAKSFDGATSVPCSPAGPFTGSTGVSVSAEITGLPEAYYRFRLLATNMNGDSEGATLLFTTSNTFGLPDGRAYEMVSPPQKSGEVIPPEPTNELGGSCGDCLPALNEQLQPMQSAPDGERVLYLGEPFISGLAAGTDEYLAARSAGGWETKSLSSSATIGQYQAFSSDLSRGVLHQEELALSPAAPSRGGKAFANLYLVQGGVHQPLVTREPPNRGPFASPGEFVIRFAGANAGTASEAAFEHVIFAANDALTDANPGIAPLAPEAEVGANESCTALGASCDLYDWSNGGLRLVNVLPGNASAAPRAVIGSGQLLDQFQTPDVDRAISDDGGRIFWSDEESGQVYVRIDGTKTVEVPGPGTCKESVEEKERACFLTASADGSRVLLSDGEVYKLNKAGAAYESAIDLTKGSGAFQGILGASEDLSRIYFTDTAVLTGGEQNANGEHAEGAKFNLYASNEGVLTFIGMLLPSDDALSGKFGAWANSPSHRTAQVTSDGGHLAFMSLAPLTGYDNAAGTSGSKCNPEIPSPPGVPCFEVFEYSAASNSLVCASCSPSGQRPIGPSNLGLIETRESEPPFRQPGNLSSDGGGRLFFESLDVLSPDDTNGHIQDVYEWEPGGLGSCKRAGGCVYLISSGHSPNDSMFLDSAPNGNDAFFITRDQLLPQDKDQQLDLYDARVGGGIASSETPPCAGEGCKEPLASHPAAQVPGSSVFSGLGNLTFSTPASTPTSKPKSLTRAQKLVKALKACAEKPKRKRRACRAQARKRYVPRSSSKSTSHKRSK